MEVSQTFFSKLEEKLKNTGDDLNGYYKTFNNCREQGLVLNIYDSNNSKDDLVIWACESRNSDNIMVITADSSCSNINDMFNDIAYKSAKYFSCGDYNSATDYVCKVIKKYFKNSFPEISNTKFVMNKSLNDIEKISYVAEDLEYEDYHDLATFENTIEGYFCDLIILNGKLGLRYSKFCDEYHEEIDNLTFEEWKPDLTSNTTLMLGMQDKLNNFIDKEIDYEVNIGI